MPGDPKTETFMSATLTSPTSPGRPAPAVPGDMVWPLTVQQYQEMIRTGILTEEDRVELVAVAW